MSERLIWRYPPPPTQAEHSNLLSIGPLCPRLATANTTKILPLNLNNKINSTECSSDRILEIQRRFSELQTIYGLSVRSGNPIRPMCFTNFYWEILSILTSDGSWKCLTPPRMTRNPILCLPLCFVEHVGPISNLFLTTMISAGRAPPRNDQCTHYLFAPQQTWLSSLAVVPGLSMGPGAD